MRSPAKEYPDRPHVRDIYAAQTCGFPIRDTREFEAYRAALTSLELLNNPEVEGILRPLAARARAWLDRLRPALWAEGNKDAKRIERGRAAQCCAKSRASAATRSCRTGRCVTRIGCCGPRCRMRWWRSW
jgi:hypothetical protein